MAETFRTIYEGPVTYAANNIPQLLPDAVLLNADVADEDYIAFNIYDGEFSEPFVLRIPGRTWKALPVQTSLTAAIPAEQSVDIRWVNGLGRATARNYGPFNTPDGAIWTQALYSNSADGMDTNLIIIHEIAEIDVPSGGGTPTPGTQPTPQAGPVTPTPNITLFGLDIAEIVHESLEAAGGLRQGRLLRQSKAATNRARPTENQAQTTYSYLFSGIMEYRNEFREGRVVRDEMPTFMIVANSIPVQPLPGDTIELDGAVNKIVSVSHDPARAMYECKTS